MTPVERDDRHYIAILGDESVTVYRRGKPIEDQVGAMYLPGVERFGGYTHWRALGEYQATKDHCV